MTIPVAGPSSSVVRYTLPSCHLYSQIDTFRPDGGTVPHPSVPRDPHTDFHPRLSKSFGFCTRINIIFRCTRGPNLWGKTSLESAKTRLWDVRWSRGKRKSRTSEKRTDPGTSRWPDWRPCADTGVLDPGLSRGSVIQGGCGPGVVLQWSSERACRVASRKLPDVPCLPTLQLVSRQLRS